MYAVHRVLRTVQAHELMMLGKYGGPACTEPATYDDVSGQCWMQCGSSTPTVRADMAAKKGAPVYSRHPPSTPTFPAWPFHASAVRGGTMRLTSAFICANRGAGLGTSAKTNSQQWWWWW